MNFPFRSKLTRKFFMELPTGAYLASNNCKLCPEPTPVFSGYVAEVGEPRIFQWEMLKALGAAQRTCDVFGSEEEFLMELDCRRGHGRGQLQEYCSNKDAATSDNNNIHID